MGSSKRMGLDSVSSSSNFTRLRGTNRRRKEDTVLCHCGVEAMKLVSRTEANPGRFFYGCPNWKSGQDCKFFKWVECVEDGLRYEDFNKSEEGHPHVKENTVELILQKLGEMEQKHEKIMWFGFVNVCLLSLMLILVLVVIGLCCKIWRLL